MVLFVFLLFFFKHKTAYEMRISDWSSDVCSSDLDQDVSDELEAQCQGEGIVRTVVYAIDADDIDGQHEHVGDTYSEAAAREVVRRLKFERTEEHTPELQSLMRISYAVFCLKKKPEHDYLIIQ